MAAHGFILLRSVEFFAGAIDKAVIHNQLAHQMLRNLRCEDSWLGVHTLLFDVMLAVDDEARQFAVNRLRQTCNLTPRESVILTLSEITSALSYSPAPDYVDMMRRIDEAYEMISSADSEQICLNAAIAAETATVLRSSLASRKAIICSRLGEHVAAFTILVSLLEELRHLRCPVSSPYAGYLICVLESIPPIVAALGYTLDSFPMPPVLLNLIHRMPVAAITWTRSLAAAEAVRMEKQLPPPQISPRKSVLHVPPAEPSAHSEEDLSNPSAASEQLDTLHRIVDSEVPSRRPSLDSASLLPKIMIPDV